MFLQTIKFAAKGISLDFESSVRVKTLRNRLQRHTTMNAMRGRSNGVVVSMQNDEFVMRKLRTPLLYAGQPLLFGQLTTEGDKTRVSGKFMFSPLFRAAFWLVTLFVVVYFGATGYRAIAEMITGTDPLELVGYSIKVLISPVIFLLMLMWYGSTLNYCFNDMEQIANSLQKAAK